MKAFDRRTVVQSVALRGLAGAGSVSGPTRASAQAPLKLKFGSDLPVMHSVNVRLGEAIEAAAKTGDKIAISLFPNGQLGSDPDMISQLRSRALERATMSSAVLSTLTPAASLTGVDFAFPRYE